MNYEAINQVADGIYNTIVTIFGAVNIDPRPFLERKGARLAESIAIYPIILLYAYETRYMIALLVLLIYIALVLPLEKIPLVWRKALTLYLVIFVWFALSKLWSGPSYYADCLWRERDQESALIWYSLYVSVLIQNVLLFAPPSIFLDFLWILNYVYPGMSMVSTCANLLVLLLRSTIVIVIWLFTPSTLRVRAVGLFLVTSLHGWIFFGIAWTICLWVNRKRKKNANV